MDLPHLFASVYSTQTTDAGLSAFLLIFPLGIVIYLLTCVWRVFAKAGQPGWAALIPIYNAYTLLKIVNRPGWWLLLFFIPGVNIVVNAIVQIELAKAFGKTTAFGVIGLFLFPYVGYAILAFDDSQYSRPTGPSAPAIA